MKTNHLLWPIRLGALLSGCAQPYQNDFKNWPGVKFVKEMAFKLGCNKTIEIKASGNELILGVLG
jgi:hypothetical protein